MDRLIVEGETRLEGTVTVSGSKNACLPIMAACLLAGGKSVLHGTPRLADVHSMSEILRELGAQVNADQTDLFIDTAGVCGTQVSVDHARRIRASFLVLGALAARQGEACVPLPGGDAIGSRPVNLHLAGLQAMGAHIERNESQVRVRVPQGRLRGAHIALDFPSVGATQNLLIAACAADGDTIIDNAACEPEMQELADALRLMGACITGDGTSQINIQGQTSLTPMSCHIGPDRMEAATFMAGAAATGGEVLIHGARPDSLGEVMAVLRQMGCTVEGSDAQASKGPLALSGSKPTKWVGCAPLLPTPSDLSESTGASGKGPPESIEELSGEKNKPTKWVRVVAPRRLQAVDLCTGPYPAFPTDAQPQLMVCAAVAQGISCLREAVHNDRLGHALALEQMGARIAVTGNRAVVEGRLRLQGACVRGGDLRAVAALILAGLVGTGTTEVTGLQHLDRGYERFEQKLQGLGARVTRVEEK